MPETAEITFPHETLARLREQHESLQAKADSPLRTTVANAILVIDHLESDATALRNTIDFMRDRVEKAIEPR